MFYTFSRMSIATLSSQQFKKVYKLIQEREALQARIESISRQIESLVGEPYSAVAPAGTKRRGRKPGQIAALGVGRPGRKRRSKRGEVTARVLEAVREAGPAGITVRELSEKLGIRNQNLHAWFQNIGKKKSELKKVGEGRSARWLVV